MLAGGASKTFKLVDTVANRLSLPVEFMNPFARIKCDGKKFEQKFLEEIAPSMTVVVGLASRRLGDK
jgi:type IV pilus assembly protein PilM